ncbi:MAG TPA: proline--tRNA ligase [Nitrospirae bacterium]|nr:proline--tRNA ligase [bacterium BMS3Abin06]HDH10884.1 proline--tRNA ligase [Nitrospirota bacterium]HDL20872.1 proline--tRNA ligase [Nitrospirota bacterium]HDZ03244.1 proline--tRNA ligase [Nitrospirota bacterium]
MRFSNIFIPTLRETPAEAEAVSHILMLRAGYVRQLAAGLYIYLPLAWRVMERINKIIREEMNAIGAQEISMPALHPSEIWEKTGRWNDIGDEMFRLKDRGGRDMCLGMTHEEIITWLASMEIRSYRNLPQVWYQIQTKFRDEARPRSGILRTREFIMKDSYSFDRDEQGLEENYRKHAETYHRIFKRCGLRYYQVESDPGMMGGALAHEFMSPSSAGEDTIVLCSKCGYAANVELAVSVSPPQTQGHGQNPALEEIATPEKRTVVEVSEFLKSDPSCFIKSLLLIGPEGPFLALLRGDQELHEKKLRKIAGEFRPAQRDEVKEILGVEAGFIGPHNNKLKKIADITLREGIYISGANKKGFHTRGIKADVHFEAGWHDIHVAKEGDKCSKCGAVIMEEKVIEIGNIFKLGTKYSRPLKAVYLDLNGEEKEIIMGSYGIGPARIAASAIEQNNDRDGIIWPKSIAPFDVEIIPLANDDKEVSDTAAEIYRDLQGENFEVLIDDRDERPGVKFKDADLIGIPYQIIIGKKGLKEGLVEFKSRETKETERIAPSDVMARVREVC